MRALNRPAPVRFPVDRSLLWGGLIAGTWALAFVPVLTALALHPPARSHVFTLLVVLAAFVLGSVLALRLWRDQASGTLVWNGAQWFLESAQAQTQTQKNAATAFIAQPGIHFDGQRWLLLRVQAGRRARWLWVAQSADAPRWHALRCALYARVSAPVMVPA